MSLLSDAERKGKEEKKNDLITRAEEIVNTAKAEERELTPDEAQELAEIRDDVKAIKIALGLDDDLREDAETEEKTDKEPTEEDEKWKKHEHLSRENSMREMPLRHTSEADSMRGQGATSQRETTVLSSLRPSQTR
jgi:hypothetical protein